MTKTGDGIAKVVASNGVLRITIDKNISESLGIKAGDFVHYMVAPIELNDEITRMKKSLPGPDRKA